MAPPRSSRRLTVSLRVTAATALVVAVALTPVSAQAADPPPLAARLLAESDVSLVVVDNLTTMWGLATDGTVAYMVNQDGNVVAAPLAGIDLTAGSTNTVSGSVNTVGWGVGGSPSVPPLLRQLSISFSHGCLFITDDANVAGAVRLYCIDVTDWSVTELAVPVSSPMPVGVNYTFSNLLDFPDGRIGKVSAYEPVTGGYESTLRTYSLTGTGKNVAVSFSEDYTTFDTDNWATDEHGVATDGTYLYRIQYKTFDPNFKSWKLVSGSSAPIEFAGNYTEPFDNPHFLAHNHLANYYLVGDYAGNSFYITQAVNPAPVVADVANPSTLADSGTDADPWVIGAMLLLTAGLVLTVRRRRAALI